MGQIHVLLQADHFGSKRPGVELALCRANVSTRATPLSQELIHQTGNKKLNDELVREVVYQYRPSQQRPQLQNVLHISVCVCMSVSAYGLRSLY